MPTFALFILIVLIIAALITLLAIVRNNWVYNVRIKMIHERFSDYKRLPSYNHMMFRFWVWDVEKFLK